MLPSLPPPPPRDADLDEMLAMGVPLIRPVFSLADSDDNVDKISGTTLRRPGSSVTFQLPAPAASNAGMPTLESHNNINTAPTGPRAANDRYAMYSEMATPAIAARSVSLLPPTSATLAAIASPTLASSSSSSSSSSTKALIGAGGRRKAATAFDSGASAPLSDLQATMRTQLELLALERSDEGDAFFRSVQEKVYTPQLQEVTAHTINFDTL